MGRALRRTLAAAGVVAVVATGGGVAVAGVKILTQGVPDISWNPDRANSSAGMAPSLPVVAPHDEANTAKSESHRRDRALELSWEFEADATGTKKFSKLNMTDGLTIFATYLTEVDGEYELDPTITLASCPRIAIIPVVENGEYGNGNATGEIVGFIPFYFAMVCKNGDPTSCVHPIAGQPHLTKADFWGYFIRLDATGLGYIEYDPNFGTKIVALAE